jgi:hypothetical protein
VGNAADDVTISENLIDGCVLVEDRSEGFARVRCEFAFKVGVMIYAGLVRCGYSVLRFGCNDASRH